MLNLSNLSISSFRYLIATVQSSVLPLTSNLYEDPNSIYNYMSEETVANLEKRFASDLQISWNVDKVSFKLWTREGGFSTPFEFNHDTLIYELLDNHFDPNRQTKILAHGFSSDVSFAEPFAKGTLIMYSNLSQHFIIIIKLNNCNGY